MKKKNGFVFVETMIVVVVLVSILLIIYSSYTSLISMERRQARYDDPAFIYKTKIVADFLLSVTDIAGEKVIYNRLKEVVSSDAEQFIFIQSDDRDMFYVTDENPENIRQNFFMRMYNDLNIQTILLINKNELDKIGKNNSFTDDFYEYLKTIDTSEDGKNQFYIAIVYAEKVNGTKCKPNELFEQNNNTNGADASLTKNEGTCTYYYSSLKLGEVIE